MLLEMMVIFIFNISNKIMSTLYSRFGEINTEFAGIPAKLAPKQDKEIGKGLSTDDFLHNAAYEVLRARATSKDDVGLSNVQDFGIATQGEVEEGMAANKKVTPAGNLSHFTRRVSYGVSEPTNADGAPNGSVFFRYGTHKATYIKITGVYLRISKLDGNHVWIKENGVWVKTYPALKINGEWEDCWGKNVVIDTFTASGTWEKPSGVETLLHLILVGGGGGAGREGSPTSYRAGAGGAGGVVHLEGYPVTEPTYAVVRGGGGSRSTNSEARGSNGGNSTFDGIVALGGGGGGSSASTGEVGDHRWGADGGSGGGRGQYLSVAPNGAGEPGAGLQPLQAGLSQGLGNNGSGNSGGGAGGGAGVNSAINIFGTEYARGGWRQSDGIDPLEAVPANSGFGGNARRWHSSQSAPAGTGRAGATGVVILIYET